MCVVKRIGVSNWTGNQSCAPVRQVDVGSVQSLAEVISVASSEGERVKAIGTGHSFTGAAMTSGVLVRCGGLNRLESIDDDGVATVGAGIRLDSLSRQLRERGRSLSSLGDIAVQTLAGATATATHGTGRDYGNISSSIRGFEIVTADGSVQWCDAENNSDIFAAGRVGLGALGVVTRIAIATERSFNLHQVESVQSIQETLADWNGFVTSAEHPEFFWIPGTDAALVKRSNRTTRSVIGRKKATAEKLLVENAAFGAAMYLINRVPSTRSRVVSLMGSLPSGGERIDHSERIFATPRHVRFIEMEYGIPIDAVPEAFGRVQRLVSSLDDPPGFPIEVRVSAPDNIDLSTSHGRVSGWIAVHRLKGAAHDEYFRGVEAIMNDYEGRPHWGKFHYQNAESLAPLYPRWDAFQAVRNRLDPNRVFANDYTDRVLGT